MGQQRSEVTKMRSISLDLARGFMLLLIALAHAPLFLYVSEPGMISRPESVGILDKLLNAIGEIFIDNRSRPLFAVLFGYGLVLMFDKQLSKGKSKIEARKVMKRRSFFLILFGFILAVFIGGQDILMAYGSAGLLVGWLLLRDNKTLMTATTIATTVFILYIPFLWGFLLEDNGSYGFSSEFSRNDYYLQSFMEALVYFPYIPIFIHLLFPILPSVLIGIWFGRIHLLTNSHQQNKLKMIAIIGILISILGALPFVFVGELWEPSLFLAGVLYGIQIITGTVGGIGYAALFGVLGNRIKEPGWVINSINALGRRSLTFFVFNEILLVILLSPVSLGLGGILNNTGVTFVAISIWILSVVTASILEKYKMSGPLETLMRVFVYK
jgi:uncharacterized membrane protein YeiB